MLKLVLLAFGFCLSSCQLSPALKPMPVGELGWRLEALDEVDAWTDVGNEIGFDSCWVGTADDPELLISMPSAMDGAGALMVLDPRTGQVLRAWSAPHAWVHSLGMQLMTVGDVDADGADDFVVLCNARWASGNWFGHVFGVSSATGRVLYQVEGLDCNVGLARGNRMASSFDSDADGLFDVLVGRAGSEGLLQICSGRDGRLLQRVDLELQDDTQSIGSLVVGESLGSCPPIAYQRRFWKRGLDRSEPLLRRVKPSQGAVTTELPRIAYNKGFWDLDGDGVPELLFEKRRQISGDDPQASGNVKGRRPENPAVFVQDLVALDIDSGAEQIVATLPRWQDADESGERTFSQVGFVILGDRHIFYCGTQKNNWDGSMVAFEVGRPDPIWISEGDWGTDNLGVMVSERAVLLDGEWVAAIGDGSSVVPDEANLLLVRVRDGKVLWHLTPEDVFGEILARTE